MISTHHPADVPADNARPRGSTSPSAIAAFLDGASLAALRPANAAADDADQSPWLGALVAVLTCDCAAADARQLELPLEKLPSSCATSWAPDGAFLPMQRGPAECAGLGRLRLLVCWRIMAPDAALLHATDYAGPVPQPVIPPGLQPGGRTRSSAAAAALARGSGQHIGPAISSA
jgi:hypothetical protein